MKNSRPIPGFSGLRARLVGTVFVAMLPALAFLYFTHYAWTGFAVGLLALLAAWFAGERFVLQQLRGLVRAVQRFGEGNLGSRTGLERERGEIGQLARAFDEMAARLEERAQEREQGEAVLLNRALQQTTVAALGQFALTSSDFSALLNQAAILVSQTLEVEFCRILELLPEGHSMVVRAGVGWNKGTIGLAAMSADAGSQAGYTLKSGEPVVFSDLRSESRFQSEPLLAEHGIISGASVAIGMHQKTYGVLGVYSTRPREFRSDDVQFLLAVANALAVAVERRRAEDELRKLAEFAELNPNPAMELSAAAAVTYFNVAAGRLAESLGFKHPRELLPADIETAVHTCLATGQSRLQLESRIQERVLSWSLHPVISSQVVHCYFTDITDQLKLEAQARQSQKLETFGQLASGLAHDFNNMLTVIQGHAGMLMARPTLPPELKESVQSVVSASQRATGLTQQLLLFSRRTGLQTRLLDLREVVANLAKSLKRVLGTKVKFEFSPPPQVPLVYGDGAMIEQVLLNLALNSRDAMPTGGEFMILIQVANIDALHARKRPEGRAGKFVFMRVSDTGCGMDAATKSRIFEPFFSTKEVGHAMGLGLATAHGIIRQHEGWIEVASEPGKGTTFDIYFPATGETVGSAKQIEAQAVPVRGGNETILLVEDDASVLKMGRLILQDCGYRVLEAASGAEALEAWQSQADSINLLLTDMIMPQGMSGMELAQKLLAQKPGLKVIYTSGHTLGDLDTDLLRRGDGVFLQKPFTRTSLANAVRASLDKPQPATQSSPGA